MNTLKIMLVMLLFGFTNVVFSLSLGSQPDNLEDLVKSSDTIVIGKLKQVKDSRSFYGYQHNTKNLEQLSKIGFNIPIVDYIVKIQKVLKAPKTGFTDKQLVLRKLFDHVPDVSVANKLIKSKPKRKQVLFLKLNPDNETYSVVSTMGIMDFSTNNTISEQLVYYVNGEEKSPFEIDEKAELTLQRIKSLAVE